MEWISVKERLPINDECVIVFMCKFGKITNAHSWYFAWFDTTNKKWTNEKEKDINDNPDYWLVTHWAEIDIPTN